MLKSFVASSIFFSSQKYLASKKKTILLPARFFTRKLFRLCNSLRAHAQSERPYIWREKRFLDFEEGRLFAALEERYRANVGRKYCWADAKEGSLHFKVIS